MSAKLADATKKAAGISNGMRTGTITAVSDSAVTISVSGGSFTDGVGVITSYTPIVGDTVAVFRQDSSWLILGPLAAATPWVLFASLGYQNGWSDRGAGFPFGAYRRTATCVQLVGQITNASIQAAGAIIVQGVPAPPGEVAGMIAEQGTSRPSLHVDATGALRIYGSSATGIMQFSCSYPLDFPA